MERRVFDASFKHISIGLSYARGSVKEVADELGIDLGRLSNRRQNRIIYVGFTYRINSDRKRSDGDFDYQLLHATTFISPL